MEKTRYDKDHAEHYDATRDLIPETRDVWANAVRKYLPSSDLLRIIDIGSGTGRFAELFAESPDASVTGVEPSDEMLKIAVSKQSSAWIRYLQGSAEALPVDDEGFDLAWMSMIIHHVENRGACAREAFRVLAPGGIAIVRNSFRGRLDGMEFYDFFPGSRELDNARLPSIEEVRKDFESAGFSFVALDSVKQVFAASFQHFYDKMLSRGTSTLRLISDDAYQQGLARIRKTLDSGSRTGPMIESIDMLVFRRN